MELLWLQKTAQNYTIVVRRMVYNVITLKIIIEFVVVGYVVG